jgi:hypothetical protein
MASSNFVVWIGPDWSGLQRKAQGALRKERGAERGGVAGGYLRGAGAVNPSTPLESLRIRDVEPVNPLLLLSEVDCCEKENAKTLGFWRVVFVPDPSTYPSTLTGRCRAAEH